MSLKISVITVCYNCEDTILKTIKSVNDQRYKNIEHIIIDGKSTDKTFDIAKNNKIKNGKIISEKDTGIYNAYNKGLKFVTGDVVSFLNADDFYPDNHILQNVIACFEKNYKIVYGNIEYFDNKKNQLSGRKFIPGIYKKDSYINSWHTPWPSFFCLKECYDKYGTFNESLNISADFELMFRFQEINNLKSYYLNQTLAYMGNGGVSSRIKNIIIGNLNVIKAFKIHKKKIFIFTFIIKRLLPKLLNLLKINFFKYF